MRATVRVILAVMVAPQPKLVYPIPFDLAIDRHGNLYVADTGNRRIRRVDAKTQKITTVLVKSVSTKEDPAP